ncbi:hypothetical protein ACJZ2D_016400 [Fusarium nematophilum]
MTGSGIRMASLRGTQDPKTLYILKSHHGDVKPSTAIRQLKGRDCAFVVKMISIHAMGNRPIFSIMATPSSGTVDC